MTQHTTWPTVADAIRAARNELSDAEWHGVDTTAAADDVRALEMEQRVGAQRVPPF